MSREAILAAVKAAGVVGAGGAGFPTHTKLAASADAIIANGAECEPLLQVDRELLSHYLDEVLVGLEVARETVGAERAYLAVKAKYEALITQLRTAVASRPWLQIAPLPDIYPIGDEQRLVYEVLGRIVPARGIPIQVGAVVLNVETLYNIAGAYVGQPVINTYITVNGAVAEPGTWAVPVGTTIQDVIKWASPVLEPSELAVIEGGPMMGRLVEDLSQPVTKTTKGLIILPQFHTVVTRLRSEAAALRRAFSVCSQCTMCTDLCPRHLLGHPLWPHRIMRSLAGSTASDPEAIAGALLCSECGVCDSYACFMGLSPRQVNQALKQQLSTHAKPQFVNLDEVREGFAASQIPSQRLTYRQDLVRWVKDAPFMGTLPEPDRVLIRLDQHVGMTAHCVLELGQEVSPGTLVGNLPDGELGALVHSSIHGVVCGIEDEVVIIERGGRDG
ncbi:MAG: electron transport complex protein RnfC [Firmicutes bacterium]|nr:electron transport complex protein RnfC [Bacillota bacterium]